MASIILALGAVVLFLVANSLSFFPNFPLLDGILTAVFAVTLPFLLTKLPMANLPSPAAKCPQKHHFALLWLLPLFVGITYSLSLFFGWIGSFFGIILPTYVGNLPILLFCHALLPAVTEECCFRHTVPSLLSPLGKKATLFGSAILFAIAHISPVMMAYAFVAGLCLGLLREYTESPLMPMLFHFVNNAFCLLLMQADISPVLVCALTLAVGILCGLVFYRKEKETALSLLSPLGLGAKEKEQTDD